MFEHINKYNLPMQSPILIVDDNLNNLKVLAQQIKDAGWRVAIAKTGRQAIELAKNNPPILILLDVIMPDLDGFETCQQLKLLPETKDIPVIFMTALNDTNNKVKGLSIGGVDYITKPFQAEEVLARINLHCQLHSLNQRLEEHNQLLEEKVNKRTAELVTALDNLQNTQNQLKRSFAEVKEVQDQLIQAAKMSDIGQMLTGIAHEINNPTVFLQGNIQPAQDYVQDLLGLIELYQKKMPNPDAEIEAAIETIDLEFIRQDLPKLLSSMNLGIERIRNISQSLRSLSRQDQEQKISFQIHEGINNSLLILQHRLKANDQRPKIKIVKNYLKIPEVQCFPSQLNQVFMNILANTLDAFDKTNQGKIYAEIELNPNIITIHTSVVAENQIQIQIQDNGCGMSIETQQRIFEQGFTTKDVDKGTGLGMAIAHQIITEKHGGTITCDSTIGQGTTFTIMLPISK